MKLTYLGTVKLLYYEHLFKLNKKTKLLLLSLKYVCYKM